ncbi:quinone-dependent dihydroorotate dehydrogenase [Brumimicrobium aurantiacum]|uniref:Dihydroorotate dehydrogenase (quinone) n=1 Tax=Brumimicrobium aurantiacum TaxID=1737063 RepID=A0A3E1EUS5_9FLAO|nr:quinone-dependent dihydroorotate dehydrogenase [Brumimicrobium aurantiacum]RFC53233.1 quinone-dependent dihydroorotate dehydrogenase [Brumimicrobium aurantiacum]
MYSIIKRVFFLFDPEKIHYITFKLIKNTLAIPGVKSLWKKLYVVEDKRLERELFGLKFKNPVGLAAGFDKNGKLFNELEYTGFGFIEVGTVTPLPQEGNPKKRLFRLVEDEAIINRMGFNNDGIEALVEKLKNRKSDLLIGGNIGKNKVTPNENAIDDYVKCFDALYKYVDYFVVNVSSPNTPNLRALQDKEPLTALLNTLKVLNDSKEIQRPILLKIAPDLTDDQLDDIIEIIDTTKIDGVIATNTTIDRSGLKTNDVESIGAGGLSGKPLTKRSTEVVRYLHTNSKGSFPIIGVGGIHSAEDAMEKFEAGASLVQIYSGFIYEGPSLVRKINEAILKS